VKRLGLLFIALLITAAASPAFALGRNDNNIVDEVIKMWKSNVAEEDIVAYVHKADTRFSVSADDVIAMTDAKVPRTVIKAVLDEADEHGDRSRPADHRTVVVSPYYAPYYGYGYGYGYGPAYYDPWYYDPFWYGPRVSIGVGFGHFRGGHFGHFRRGR